MVECIFCKIVAGQLPADIVYEDEHTLAFKDINPLAPVHVLVIPKTHVSNLDDVDPECAGQLVSAIQRTAKALGVEGGYKAVTNCGEAAGQVVHHVHFHLLAGKKFVP